MPSKEIPRTVKECGSEGRSNDERPYFRRMDCMKMTEDRKITQKKNTSRY